MYKAGDFLAGHKLLKECGIGSFGSVFLAENSTTGQKFALKILYKNGNHYERELAGLIAYQEKCRHANLMRIYHVGQNDDCIFYTLDAADNLNVDGEYLPDTLANRLRRKKRLTASELQPMLDELLNGLEILHHTGLLHRDIKPDNILWVNGRAVLGDIGLVTPNCNASLAGTPGFISPEVWNGKRTFEPRDDLYALAMTIYCALSGCGPRDYPDLPFSLTLGGARDLIRIYNAAIAPDSCIRTVADWRRMEALPPKRKKYPKIIFCGIALLVLFSGIGIFRWIKTGWFTHEIPRVSRPDVVSDIPFPELPPVPPMPKNYEEVEKVKSAGKILWMKYHEKVIQIKSEHPENHLITTRAERFIRLKEQLDSVFKKKYPEKFPAKNIGLKPLTEELIQDKKRQTELMEQKFDRTAFTKEYTDYLKKSQDFLAVYPIAQQAIYRYAAAKIQERANCFLFEHEDLSTNPDTFSNRRSFERDFTQWYRSYQRLLQTEKELLNFSDEELDIPE